MLSPNPNEIKMEKSENGRQLISETKWKQKLEIFLSSHFFDLIFGTWER